ncbi:protein transport protein Sec31A [Trichonephila clavata]|uniref:Protein transport protein Sec31A n=1 Tax=Trichonephila clavata TaxID=2740835 RepID=A0A8X6KZT6_TRICU|nr:protein transport protein Sec31A [Trichonephila clavata]
MCSVTHRCLFFYSYSLLLKVIMKVKEIDRTANIAWSPAAHHPIYLAAGTAAQQLDATFSTTAALEIYALNLTEPGLDMCMKGSVVSDFRFHKVIWGCEGMKTSEMSSGIIVGGADGGNIMIYDAAKLIQGESATLHSNTKHTGPVHSLDFNKFQDCLLASGASESEIFIWDLNNPTAPVTLGAKSQPLEDVTCVSWNCQVQHILASTFPARCFVWDLRKNEPIIKVSDSSSRLRCKVVCWHPEVATQLCLASEDDHSPVIQLWDLRYATSPLKTLEHHQRGVLSIAWCPQDPDLLLSCGKDNRILCWNPNSNVENGEVLCELPAGSQWSFDVAWCPRNPAIIANSSCDGHVGVFSLMGGQQQVQCSSKIAESFPGSDTLIQPPNVESIHRHISVPLQRPPKWLRKPVGASFGFGGKLVSFTNEASTSPQAGDYAPPRLVHISQVVTEPEILKKSEKLESSLSNGNLIEFCQSKSDASQTEQERITWNFLQATFNSAPRSQMLSLLGYNYEKVVSEINMILKSKGFEPDTKDLNDEFSNLTTNGDVDDSAAFDNIAMKTKDDDEPLYIQTDPYETDGLISQALLTGNIASAVDICVQDNRWADALVLAQAGGPQILQKTQHLYFKSVNTNASKLISAVVTSDWHAMVKKCNIACWKEMLAAVLTYAKPEDFASLCEILGNRLENDSKLQQNAALCYISAGNLEKLAQSWVNIHKDMDVNSLQHLIEQVMVLRRAVEQLSGHAPALETGVLSSLLGQYAELLATQGSLNSAVTYLVDPNERTLAILRDRIYQALGHRSPNFPFQRVEVGRSSSISQVPSQYSQQQPTQYQDRRRSSNVSTHSQYSYGGPTQPVQNTFAYSSNATSMYQPPAPPVMTSPPNSMMTPVMPPVPAAVPPVPPPAATEPPSQGSIKSRQNSGGPHHLSQRYPKHLHDPSVYSENTFSSAQQYYQQTPSFPVSQPQMNTFQPQPTQSFYSPPEPNVPASFPYAPVSNTGPSYQPPYSSYSSVSQGAQQYNNPPPAVPPAPLPSCYNEVKPGWNDPPLLKQSAKAPVSTYESPTPITRPFPDMPAVEPQGPPPVQNTGPGGYFMPSYPTQPPAPAPGFMNQAPMVPAEMIEEAKPAPVSVPEPPKEKGPIPPEHQMLQDMFEDLRRQCQQVATNPQTRRKLDDVAKKLENLYDKLRDNTLSSAVTLGLHQIVQAIMHSDYPTALGIHGQLVANANFSEISGFMPSLKVLLQTASQLNVFLQ